jgi:hypothetical protein
MYSLKGYFNFISIGLKLGGGLAADAFWGGGVFGVDIGGGWGPPSFALGQSNTNGVYVVRNVIAANYLRWVWDATMCQIGVCGPTIHQIQQASSWVRGWTAKAKMATP